jgi:chitinase
MGILLLVTVLFFQCGPDSKTDESNDTDKYRVIAYVNGINVDNWGPNLEKAKMITHINYAFANIKDGRMVLGDSSDIEDFIWLNGLKKVNPDLQILISVGGWGWSGNFSDAVLTEQARERFANSAVEFMLAYELDGVDLDWEYPGLPGAGNTHRPEDKENFTAILKRIRQKLDSVGGSDHHYLLTIATAASQRYLDHTEMDLAQEYLDFINIMTYDYHGGGNRVTGHHSNFTHSDEDPDRRPMSSEIAVNQHLEAGIPKEKLVLGVPFYGRWWKGAYPENNGLFQPTYGPTGAWNYYQLADSLVNNSEFELFWDDKSSAPFIYRKSDSLFVTFENKESLALKTQYVVDRGLNGIMFWQFNGDNGDLLEVIHNGLNSD